MKFSRSDAKYALKMELLHRIHELKQKIEIYTKMYGDFDSFEKKTYDKKESFEDWDSYVEWKAYREELAEAIKNDEELMHDHFEIT
ncbi:MAG: hypothetical protein GF398_10520 [Chitinivibrionales bacterium]|nr:hypothetical protein [Chitinivibrionales bacterium]